jgi:type IV secretion system protein TrbL
MHRPHRTYLIGSAFGALILTTVAFGQGATALPAAPVVHGQLDQITNNFLTVSKLWEADIVSAATRLFWILAGIEMTYTGISIALKGSGLQEFVAEFIRRILFIGFGVALLTYGQSWASAIINSFFQIGSTAIQDSALASGAGDIVPSGNLTPSLIVGTGISYAQAYLPVVGVASLFDPGPALGIAIIMGLAMIMIIIGFSLIAVREVMVLCEMYIVLSAGVIMLGFGGSRWTKSYADRYLKYAVSVGIKLMFMQLVVALTVAFLNSLTIGTAPPGVTGAFSVVASIIICVVLVFIIPNIAAGLLRGDSTTHGGEAVGMAMTMTMMATQMTSAVAKIAAMPFTGGTSGLSAAADLKGATTRAGSLATAGLGSFGGEGGGAGPGPGLRGGLGKPPGATPAPKGPGK